jgi:hypothetical protein
MGEGKYEILETVELKTNKKSPKKCNGYCESLIIYFSITLWLIDEGELANFFI